MKPAFVDKIKPYEVQEAQDAFNRLHSRNLLDPEVFAYPATAILKATVSGKKVVYMPIQTCYVLESLGIPQDATPLEVASGLKSLVITAAWEGKKAGHGELMFLCQDEETGKFAEHNGFERVNVSLFRMKL